MKEKDVKQAFLSIEMSEEGKRRMINNSRKKRVFPVKRCLAICACLMALVALYCISPIADPKDGYFVDEKKGSAVVGSRYEQATREVQITTEKEGNTVKMHIGFQNKDKAPFCHTEQIRIEEIVLVDSTGNRTVKAVHQTVAAVDAKAVILLEIEDAAVKWELTHFYIEKKADAPLMVCGAWEGYF